MPRTQYGIRVTPNARKQYGFKASAAPLLSNQKRYVVQVENKIVQHSAYPVMLPANSRRKAQEIMPDLVRRKTKEILVDLHQAEQGGVYPHILDGVHHETEQTFRISTVISAEIQSLESIERMTEHDAAILSQERAERPVEHDVICSTDEMALRSIRILETDPLTSVDFVQRNSVEETILIERDSAKRKTDHEGVLSEQSKVMSVNTTVHADLSSHDQLARINEEHAVLINSESMQPSMTIQDVHLMHHDAASRISDVFGHLAKSEAGTLKHKEFLSELKIMDGVIGAGKPVLEMPLDFAKRQEKVITAVVKEQTKSNSANRVEDAALFSASLSDRTIKEIEVSEKEISPARRPEKVVNTHLLVPDRAERTYNTELALLLQQEKTVRKSKVITTQHIAADVTKRLTMIETAVLKVMDDTERVSTADNAILQSLDAAERSILLDEALLMESISAERSGEGIETIIRNSDPLERVTETDAQLSEHHSGQRVAVNEVQFVHSDTVDRVAVDYATLIEFSTAAKTMKSGVLVESETVGRIAVEETILLEQDQIELYVKKKKKIWLIPARGNHWNGWSGWKKTR